MDLKTDEALAKAFATIERQIREMQRENRSAAEIAPLLVERQRLIENVQASWLKPPASATSSKPKPKSGAEVWTTERAAAALAGKSGASRYLVGSPGLDPRSSDDYRDALRELRNKGSMWSGIDFALYQLPAIRDLELQWRIGDRLVFFMEWWKAEDSWINAFARFFQERYPILTRGDVQVWTLPTDAARITLDGRAATGLNLRVFCDACGLPAFTHRYAPDNTSATLRGTWECLQVERPKARPKAAWPASTVFEDGTLPKAGQPFTVEQTWLGVERDEDAAFKPTKPKPKTSKPKPAPVLQRTERDYGDE